MMNSSILGQELAKTATSSGVMMRKRDGKNVRLLSWWIRVNGCRNDIIEMSAGDIDETVDRVGPRKNFFKDLPIRVAK